jgi:prophage antirepressor-like protein
MLPQVFTYNNHTIRTAGTPEAPLFCARDVCEVLGISKYRDALARLDEDERGSVQVDTPGGKQSLTFVTEPGLYRWTLGSRKPEARAFKRWVTHEVLPSIRKSGGYQSPRSSLAALRETVDQLIEHEERIAFLEAHQLRFDREYVSVSGYCNLKGIACCQKMAAAVGKRAAAIARSEDVEIFDIPHERHGKVNIYPPAIIHRALIALGHIREEVAAL